MGWSRGLNALFGRPPKTKLVGISCTDLPITAKNAAAKPAAVQEGDPEGPPERVAGAGADATKRVRPLSINLFASFGVNQASRRSLSSDRRPNVRRCPF